MCKKVMGTMGKQPTEQGWAVKGVRGVCVCVYESRYVLNLVTLVGPIEVTFNKCLEREETSRV